MCAYSLPSQLTFADVRILCIELSQHVNNKLNISRQLPLQATVSTKLTQRVSEIVNKQSNNRVRNSNSQSLWLDVEYLWQSYRGASTQTCGQAAQKTFDLLPMQILCRTSYVLVTLCYSCYMSILVMCMHWRI